MGEDAKLCDGVGAWTNSWTSDGQTLLYDVINTKTGFDIMKVSLTGDHKPQVVLQTPFNEGRERLSPDGRWLAYESDESGRLEVYVMSWSGQPGKWQISTNGGQCANWSRDGRELFYLANDGRLMVVPIPSGPMMSPGLPQALFRVSVNTNQRNVYSIAPDGRFLFIEPEQELLTPITAIVNWHSGAAGRK
jgi:Tol biopolymer transport system component